jgi:hypothetical protein
MRGRSKRIEERVCIDSLVQHLKAIGNGAPVDAQDERDDPPDYWLTVGEHRYAVEVTSIVTSQAHAAVCRRLLRTVQKKYDQDPVPGTYALTVMRTPRLPGRASRGWKELVTKADALIRTMSSCPAVSDVTLLRDDAGRVVVRKLSESGRKLGMCRVPRAKWQGNARTELAGLLQEVIAKKRPKIQRKGIMLACPDVVLALYDAYGYAEIDDAREAFSSVERYEWLHSIYWAASFSDRVNTLYPGCPGRGGGFIYTKDEAWR